MKNTRIKIPQVFSLPAFLLIMLCACKEKSTNNTNSPSRLTVFTVDTALHFTNGNLCYKDKLFTGSTEEKFPNGQPVTTAEYLNGKENGPSRTFYSDGTMQSERFYTNGMKDSIGHGWWPDGKMKFEYHFKDDVYNGAFTEWYSSGQMTQQIMYANGKELSGRGWRENGKLYMNFIWKGNRRYGLVNPNMCYGIAKGQVKE
jgi:antitoxin component YwqK of YwqJK toxin-antitoxin module